MPNNLPILYKGYNSWGQLIVQHPITPQNKIKVLEMVKQRLAVVYAGGGGGGGGSYFICWHLSRIYDRRFQEDLSLGDICKNLKFEIEEMLGGYDTYEKWVWNNAPSACDTRQKAYEGRIRWLDHWIALLEMEIENDN